MKTLYEFKNVGYIVPQGKRHPSPLTILDSLSFSVEQGELLTVTGPSGSGKSTLLRLFNRLIDPSSGVILFNGKNIEEYPVLELRRQIGWVPQTPVRFSGTAEDNLRLPFTISKELTFSKKEIDESIEYLASLGILQPEIMKRNASDLSVGEAQRLNLLRALVLKPDILLLDEPTSALDPDSAGILLQYVKKIHADFHITVIMVSHRPDEVNLLKGRVIKLESGRIVENKLH